MKLYDMPGNANSRKIRAVAKELDLRLDIIPVDLREGEHKKPEYLNINPNGKIPALVDGDLKLFESNAILCYVAAKGGDTSLLPTDIERRAQVDQWLFWQSSHLSQAFGKILFERIYKGYLNLGEPDQQRIDEGVAELDRYCEVLDGILGRSEYVCGDLTVADFSLAGTFGRREAAQVDISKFANINRWLTAIETRPSWVHADAE